MELLQQYTTALAQIGSTADKAKALNEMALAITVADHEDQANYLQAETLHKKLVSFRTKTEKARKAAQEPARAAIAEFNDHVKQLLAILSPGEKHLAAEVAKVKDHEKRLKEAAEREAEQKLNARIEELKKYDAEIPIFLLAAMDDENYQAELAEAKALHERRAAIAAAESEERRTLASENATLRAELQEQRREKRMEEIRQQFPTLETAWDEIYRLETEVF